MCYKYGETYLLILFYILNVVFSLLTLFMETTYCCILFVIGYKAIMKLNVVEVSCRNKVPCGYNVHYAIKERKHNKF